MSPTRHSVDISLSYANIICKNHKAINVHRCLISNNYDLFYCWIAVLDPELLLLLLLKRVSSSIL